MTDIDYRETMVKRLVFTTSLLHYMAGLEVDYFLRTVIANGKVCDRVGGCMYKIFGYKCKCVDGKLPDLTIDDAIKKCQEG